MPATDMIAMIVNASDVLIPVTLVTIWMAIRRAGATPRVQHIFAAFLLLAFISGAVWTWVPSMAALRFLPPPSGQGGCDPVGAGLLPCAHVYPCCQGVFSFISP